MSKSKLMALGFSKMHGIGNDFVIVDARHAPLPLSPEELAGMADRRRGVGFDQLISIESPRDPAHLARYSIWNADGSPAGQCGNGARCVAAWLHRAGVLPLATLRWLESPSGPVQVQALAADQVEVMMGSPDFTPAHIPFQAEQEAPSYRLELAGESIELGAVSLGNPHAVLEVADLDDPALARWGPALTRHPRFPEQANIGFVQIRHAGHIVLRVHERGSGWTEACGSGACAAVAVLRQRGQVEPRVQVDLPGGRLDIVWEGPGHPLRMRGPAAFVFEGQWPLDAAAKA